MKGFGNSDLSSFDLPFVEALNNESLWQLIRFLLRFLNAVS